jgi:hypothetical protein
MGTTWGTYGCILDLVQNNNTLIIVQSCTRVDSRCRTDSSVLNLVLEYGVLNLVPVLD